MLNDVFCVSKIIKADLPSYSKGIRLSFFTSHQTKTHAQKWIKDNVVQEKGIYQLQVVKVNNYRFTICYDSGCGDFVSRRSAIDKIGDEAVLKCDGSVNLGGIGGITTQSPHGVYTVKLTIG